MTRQSKKEVTPKHYESSREKDLYIPLHKSLLESNA